ncbi:MAG: hypothetical protein IKB00_09005, partial [Bacteroidaceae bacterium]|nr:hypothetical protein [Bacteroidaceae bacterium]
MRKLMVAAMMLAAVSLSVNAAKKDKKEVSEPVLGIKSGVITMANNMGQFQGFGGGMGGGQFGGGQRPQGAPQGGRGGQGGQRGERQMNFDPSQMVTKIYFDDYGKKTVTVTTRGEAGTTRSLVIGEDNYQINDAEKSATKMPSFGGRRGGQGGGRGMGGFGGGMMGGMGAQTTPMFDWENLDAKTIKKNKIKELGEEEVAGVMCKMYSVTQSNQGYQTQMTLWIYKNLTMKSETVTDYGTMGQTVEKLEETDVDPALFELPADYKVEEMQMNFGGGAGMGGFG